MNKDKNMLQGDGIKKTYREKTELDRNIECKGAYSVAEFVFVERNWMEESVLEKRTRKLRLLERAMLVCRLPLCFPSTIR